MGSGERRWWPKHKHVTVESQERERKERVPARVTVRERPGRKSREGEREPASERASERESATKTLWEFLGGNGDFPGGLRE